MILAFAAAQAQETTEHAVHWAYSSYFGTGWYQVSGDRDVFVIRMTPRWELSEAELADDGTKSIGIELRFPITAGLEQSGLLTLTENEELQPGREMTRIPLNDILAVVRVEGETGSHRDPQWTTEIEILGAELDDALANAVGEKSLSDLLDESRKGSE